MRPAVRALGACTHEGIADQGALRRDCCPRDLTLLTASPTGECTGWNSRIVQFSNFVRLRVQGKESAMLVPIARIFAQLEAPPSTAKLCTHLGADKLAPFLRNPPTSVLQNASISREMDAQKS